MGRTSRLKWKYSHFSIGEESKIRLFANLCAAWGFEYAGPDIIRGSSGLAHPFDAVGRRDKNVLLVAGGVEGTMYGQEFQGKSPREQMEAWRNSALLASYDVQSALREEGYITDLMFFHNIKNGTAPESEDVLLSITESRDPLETLANRELATVAESVGASFLSLEDLSVNEILELTRAEDEKSVKIADEISRRLRLYQYFSPPTDELLISAYDVSRNKDQALVPKIYEASVALGHDPSKNVLVPDADFRDPIATAVALEKHKYIEYERTVEITPDGKRITEAIRKTAQGSFIIRLLKNIGLPDLAKAIIEGLGKSS